jgi:hypothetical protein
VSERNWALFCKTGYQFRNFAQDLILTRQVKANAKTGVEVSHIIPSFDKTEAQVIRKTVPS